MKKRSKKKPGVLAEYAALMGRVAEYLAYERECIAAEQAAQFDALHGGKEKRPSKAELKKAKHELAQAEEPIDEYNVNRQVVKDRAEAAKPSAPPPDILSLGQPLALAQVGGGDPFPKEWERLRGELVDNSDLTDRVCAEIERRHSELVALISGDDNDAATIADAAQSFKCYLEGIAKPPRKSPQHPTDQRAIDILAEGVRRRTKTQKHKDKSWREIALSLLEQENAKGFRPYWGRMMGDDCVIIPSTDKRVQETASNWGKYMSYYAKK